MQHDSLSTHTTALRDIARTANPSTRPVLQISRQSTSLKHQVTDELRQALLDGRFLPGAKLIERELCESLGGISRTLLREVLQHLQAEGLITSIPHKGPTVASININDVKEIYAVRQSLEALAGASFAENASEDQIRLLRSSLDYLATSGASSSTENLLTAKNEFYSILIAGCGNKVLGQMLTQLNNRVNLLRRLSLSQPGRLPNTLAELNEIVEAIEARNSVRTRDLCSDHVRKAGIAAIARFHALAVTQDSTG